MKIPMSEGGVPLAVTYRKILRKPKMVRERRFVGVIRLAKNLLVKAIEVIEQSAFETKIEYIDPGQSVAVHWAITVGNPFDTTPGKEMKSLVAFRIDNEEELPTSGVHFEVITPAPEQKHETPPEAASRQQVGPQSNLAHDLTPEQFELLRKRQQEEILKDTRGANGEFVRPPATQYAPRPVKTIDDEEEPIGELEDEEPAHLDWPGSLGEDD